MLKFESMDGTIIDVRERTLAQIETVLKRYMSPEERSKYKYIHGTQEISRMNGNIYAKFEGYDQNGKRLLTYSGEPFIATLYVADYYDYIDEIIKKEIILWQK